MKNEALTELEPENTQPEVTKIQEINNVPISPFLPELIKVNEKHFIYYFRRRENPIPCGSTELLTCFKFSLVNQTSIPINQQFEITQLRLSWEVDTLTHQIHPFLAKVYTGLRYHTWDKTRQSLDLVVGNVQQNKLIWDQETLSYFVMDPIFGPRYMLYTLERIDGKSE